MNFEFDLDFLTIAAIVVGVIFMLKILLGFICRLVEISASKKILNGLYEFTDKFIGKLFGTFKDE